MQHNRRQFLKSTAAVTVASRIKALGANDRIRVAAIGCGGRTMRLAGLLNSIGGAEIVAVCDVYEPYNRRIRARFAPEARVYNDYRQVLERPDIDAVVIGSPDHWHALMTVDAIRAGKDIYVEKPVSHTIEEGERLRHVAEKSGQIVQVGYQQRSWQHFRRARDVVTGGRLGTIHLILTFWYQTWLRLASDRNEVKSSELDWKRWLGPAPEVPFSAERFYNWRWFWNYGGGHLTDLFSHWCDTIHWFLDLEKPDEVQAMGGSYAFKSLECPDTVNASWKYSNQLLTVYNGMQNCHIEGGGIVFRGEKAMMKLNHDGFVVYPEGVVPRESAGYPEPEILVSSTEDGTIAHLRNFLDCVRSRKLPNAPLSSCIAAADVAHRGNALLQQHTAAVRG